MGLSEEFYDILSHEDEDPEACNKAAELVLKAPVTTESTGLLALMYYDGIGVEQDTEKAFEYAEIAAEENEGVALYIWDTCAKMPKPPIKMVVVHDRSMITMTQRLLWKDVARPTANGLRQPISGWVTILWIWLKEEILKLL